MRILALESSALTASCAVCEENLVVYESSITAGLTHSQTLMVMVENMLKSTNQKLEDIDAIAVSVGPGSFTGLRIGVSSAKGMAKALRCPCIGVSTLYGLARNLEGMEVIVCSVMDARRNQVYNALFDMRRGKDLRICEDRAVSVDELIEQLKLMRYGVPVVLVGDGAEICYRKMKEVLDVRIAPPQLRLQRAVSVGFCGLEKLKKGDFSPEDEVIPKYLRLSQAERIKKELGGKQ